MLSRCVYCLTLVLWSTTACMVNPQRAAFPRDATPEPTIRISGSGTALPLVMVLAEAYGRAHPGIHFQFDAGTNSGGAMQGVLKGTLDLAVANRPLSEAEASEPLEFHSFARDAVVFAVNQPNPIDGVSTAQVQSIYGGSLLGWQELGVSNEAIIALDRDEDESARKEVLLSLMAGNGVQARTVTLTTAKDMVSALASTPNSIGYTSLGLLSIMHPHNVKVLPLDGIAPGLEALSSGSYPWFLTFGVINRADAPQLLRRFVDFLIGPEAGRIMKEYGYVTAEG